MLKNMNISNLRSYTHLILNWYTKSSYANCEYFVYWTVWMKISRKRAEKLCVICFHWHPASLHHSNIVCIVPRILKYKLCICKHIVCMDRDYVSKCVLVCFIFFQVFELSRSKWAWKNAREARSTIIATAKIPFKIHWEGHTAQFCVNFKHFPYPLAGIREKWWNESKKKLSYLPFVVCCCWFSFIHSPAINHHHPTNAINDQPQCITLRISLHLRIGLDPLLYCVAIS